VASGKEHVATMLSVLQKADFQLSGHQARRSFKF
jgi:hypothetical protein